MACAADRLFDRALSCHRAGDAARTSELCRKALRLSPAHADALNLLGVVCLQAGSAGEGMSFIRRALAIAPRHAQARNNLGNALAALNRADEAAACYREALAIDPAYAGAHNNLGNVLRELGRDAEAMACYREALALQPDFAQAHNNLGNVLLDAGQPADALSSYGKALSAAPGYADAHSNLGNALRDLNRHGEAMASYGRALAIAPGFAPAVWNRSHLLLAQGRFAEGWRDYEMRWLQRGKTPLPPTPFPLWLGEGPIAGMKLLVQPEQGLGDAIQMLRYLPLLEQRGAQCHVQLPEPLVRLARRSFPGSHVYMEHERPGDIDLRIPLMSLPLAMRTFAEQDIPAPAAYLRANPSRIEWWRARLPAGQPLVGVAWRGNPGHRNDRRRSAALEDIMPLFTARPGVNFVTLQKSLAPGERAMLGALPNVRVLDGELADLDETAAVMACLDGMASVDSAPAHLAAALGLATWILLPFSAEWRWQAGRADSPWYPAARLLRQRAAGDWSGPVSELCAALDELQHARGADGPASRPRVHS